MKHGLLIVAACSALAALALAVLTVAAFAQTVMQSPPRGVFPETVTIRASMPEDARICVEPRDGGIVSCRKIGDLRIWIVQRTGK